MSGIETSSQVGSTLDHLRNGVSFQILELSYLPKHVSSILNAKL